MDFRLKKNENFNSGIKRVALSLNDQAISHVKEWKENDPHKAVHETRKRLKELRALLRLIRLNLGEELYKEENKFFRDHGRRLSEVRDSKAFIEAIDSIKEKYKGKVYKNAFSEIENYLNDQLQRISEEIDLENTLLEIKESLDEHSKVIQQWDVQVEGYNDIAANIKKVYKRGYKLNEKVKEQPTAKNFHEWRKRAKYMRFQMDLLRFLWPDMLEAEEDGFHDLTDLLGDDHDYAEMIARIEQQDIPQDEMKIFRSIANDIRTTSQQDAVILGDKLYCEKPSGFVNRLGSYWLSHEKSYTHMNKIPQL